MSALQEQRRYFAEELEAVCGLRTPALVDAFASVPREAFLPPGPWLIRSETDYFVGGPRYTPDGDARRVCHNIAVAIDPAKVLKIGLQQFITKETTPEELVKQIDEANKAAWDERGGPKQ